MYSGGANVWYAGRLARRGPPDCVRTLSGTHVRAHCHCSASAGGDAQRGHSCLASRAQQSSLLGGLTRCCALSASRWRGVPTAHTSRLNRAAEARRWRAVVAVEAPQGPGCHCPVACVAPRPPSTERRCGVPLSVHTPVPKRRTRRKTRPRHDGLWQSSTRLRVPQLPLGTAGDAAGASGDRRGSSGSGIARRLLGIGRVTSTLPRACKQLPRGFPSARLPTVRHDVAWVGRRQAGLPYQGAHLSRGCSCVLVARLAPGSALGVVQLAPRCRRPDR